MHVRAGFDAFGCSAIEHIVAEFVPAWRTLLREIRTLHVVTASVSGLPSTRIGGRSDEQPDGGHEENDMTSRHSGQLWMR
jgi:hypothetical protein